MHPEVGVYDEPTTGLDPIMSDVINELILQTHAAGTVTSVVVTHDMQTVRKVANRVVMLYPIHRLKPGEPQIVFAGTAQETFESDDEHVAQFVAGRRRTDVGIGTMNDRDRKLQFRVGIFVIVASIIAGVIVFQFGEFQLLWQPRYTLAIHFEEAPGVYPSTPVRQNGIAVGKVSEIVLDEKHGGRAGAHQRAQRLQAAQGHTHRD